MSVPAVLHLGSGRTFVEDWLNVDADPGWSPDVVWDVTQPLPIGPVPTQRFGMVELGPDRFAEIVAFDVLEHIVELPAAMTNCLTLLREGGRMRITVPYDLSLGAWQDPTHVRAFNEHSFAYFCEWFWYLGWSTHRFARLRVDFVPSELGGQLAAEGIPHEQIARTPRAVASLYVELEKRALDAADREQLEQFRARTPIDAASLIRSKGLPE